MSQCSDQEKVATNDKSQCAHHSSEIIMQESQTKRIAHGHCMENRVVLTQFQLHGGKRTIQDEGPKVKLGPFSGSKWLMSNKMGLGPLSSCKWLMSKKDGVKFTF